MWKSFVLHENCCIFNKRCLLRMIYHIFKVIQGQNNHCFRFYLETVLFKATVQCVEAGILCSWCACCHYAKLWSLSERRVKDTYEHEYISNCSLLEGLCQKILTYHQSRVQRQLFRIWTVKDSGRKSFRLFYCIRDRTAYSHWFNNELWIISKNSQK